MPDPKDDAKATGGVHPPGRQEEAQQRPRGRPDTEGAPGTGQDASRDLENEARPGKGENQAGFLKEKDGEAGRNT